MTLNESLFLSARLTGCFMQRDHRHSILSPRQREAKRSKSAVLQHVCQVTERFCEHRSDTTEQSCSGFFLLFFFFVFTS